MNRHWKLISFTELPKRFTFVKVEVFHLIPVESPVSLKSNNLNLTVYKSVAVKLLGLIFISESLSYLTLDILLFCTIFVSTLSKMADVEDIAIENLLVSKQSKHL